MVESGITTESVPNGNPQIALCRLDDGSKSFHQAVRRLCLNRGMLPYDFDARTLLANNQSMALFSELMPDIDVLLLILNGASPSAEVYEDQLQFLLETQRSLDSPCPTGILTESVVGSDNKELIKEVVAVGSFMVELLSMSCPVLAKKWPVDSDFEKEGLSEWIEKSIQRAEPQTEKSVESSTTGNRASRPHPWPPRRTTDLIRLGDLGRNLLARIRRIADESGNGTVVSATILEVMLTAANDLHSDIAPRFLRELVCRCVLREAGKDSAAGWLREVVDPILAVTNQCRGAYLGWLARQTNDTEGETTVSAQRITFGAWRVLAWAAHVAEETATDGVIQGRHLVAGFLLAMRVEHETERESGALRRLREIGADPVALCGAMFEWLIRTMPTNGSPDNLDAWRELLAPNSSIDALLPVPEFQADSATGEDLIGIAEDVNAFAAIIAAGAVKPPMAIGLFGDWGSGKSFFMESVRNRIRFLAERADELKKHRRKTEFLDQIVQIEFNAWHYVEANLWASLVTHVFECLHHHFHPVEETREKWERLLKELDEQTHLDQSAQAALTAAEQDLAKAEQQENEKRRSLTNAFTSVWKGLEESDTELGSQLENVRSTFDDSEIQKLKEEFLSRRGEVAQLQSEFRSFWGIATRTLSQWPSLITAGGIVAVVILIHALAGGTQAEWLQGLSRVFNVTVGLLMAGLGWAGTGITKARSILGSVSDISSSIREHLTASDSEQLRQARQSLNLAEDAVRDRRRQISEIRIQLDELQPSRRLGSFLQERVSSGDYQRHLGVAAMIRRDFERLQEIMDEQYQFRDIDQVDFAAEDAREQLNNGELPGVVIELISSRDDLRAATTAANSQSESENANSISSDDSITIREMGDGWHIEDSKNHWEIDLVESEGRISGIIRRTNVPRIDRIVLYIDDLDRCPPRRVVEVLQAVHLLLSFKLFVVVVAVDARWVSESLRRRYQELWKLDGEQSDQEDVSDHQLRGRLASPQDYLEKIFQIPFWLQPLSHHQTSSYVRSLVKSSVLVDERHGDESVHRQPPVETDESTQELTEGTTLVAKQVPEASLQPASSVVESTVDFMNPAQLLMDSRERDFMIELTPLVGRSPRGAKRFVNVYRLIRMGLHSEEITGFLGEPGKPNDYQAVLWLLAVVVGAPGISQGLFELIAGDETERDLQTLLQELEGTRKQHLTQSPPRDELKPGFLADHDWTKLVSSLDRLNDKPADIRSIQQLPLPRLREWMPRVSRFSFRVGRITE